MYLEYPEAEYQDKEKSVKRPYVYMTRRGEPEHAKHFTQLLGSDDAIDFDTLVTLEASPDIFPRHLLRLPMHVGSVKGALWIWSDTAGVEVVLASTQLQSYEELYAQIFKLLKTHLSARPQLE